jgi:hypothetical protein
MEKRFRFLRFSSVILKVVAWIVLIGTVIGALIVTVAGGIAPLHMLPYGPFLGIGGGAIMGFVVLVLGLLHFLFFYAGAEMILLLVAIEENTRRTA